MQLCKAAAYVTKQNFGESFRLIRMSHLHWATMLEAAHYSIASDMRLRWNSHILGGYAQAEGSLWRGLGMLVAGGGLRSAVLMLCKVRMPDCGQALAQAVAEAQLDNKQGSPESGACLCTTWCYMSMPCCLLPSVY